MTGVPMEEVTAHDFMQVRAALVARLGGANEALVWTRIHYRCSDDVRAYVDSDGVAWWPASSAAISAEVGLSDDQVDRALKSLRAAGFLDATEHRLGGNYDRTKSWRPVVLDPRGVDSANSRNGVRDSADRTPRNRGQDSADSRNVPTTETENYSSNASGSDDSKGAKEWSEDVVKLCELLRDLVVANGNRKPSITQAWLTEADRLYRLDRVSVADAVRVLRWSQADSFWSSNILSMPTFRKQYDRLRMQEQRLAAQTASADVDPELAWLADRS